MSEVVATAEALPDEETKHALVNDAKMHIFAPSSVEGKNAKFSLGYINSNPRFTIWTQEPPDESNNFGKISANLDMPAFVMMLELLEKVEHTKEECKFAMDNMNFTYVNNEKSAEPSKVSELWCGRDADGGIWISISAVNRPKIKFYFNLSTFHSIRKGDGSTFSKAELADMAVRSYRKTWFAAMLGSANKMFAPRERPTDKDAQQGSNQNSGGYQKKPWQNNQGGGYQKKPWQGGGGGGNYQKKPWQNNQGGGNNYQRQNNAPADMTGGDLPF